METSWWLHFQQGQVTLPRRPPPYRDPTGEGCECLQPTVQEANANHMNLAFAIGSCLSGQTKRYLSEDRKLDAGLGQIQSPPHQSMETCFNRLISKWINVITRCHFVKKFSFRTNFSFLMGKTWLHGALCRIVSLFYMSHTPHLGGPISSWCLYFPLSVWFCHHLQQNWCFTKPTALCPSAPPHPQASSATPRATRTVTIGPGKGSCTSQAQAESKLQSLGEMRRH